MTMVSTRPRAARRHPARSAGRRRLAAATLITSFGNGLYLTIAALFFTRTLGFGTARVGVVLTVAGLAGVLASVPAGRAADRYGIKRMSALLLCGEAVGMGALAFCTTFWAFAVVVCATTALDRAAASVRQALYAQAFDPETRVADRAYIRAVTNAAIGLGAAVAALALQADSRAVYQAAIVADAVSFLGVVALLPGIALRGAAVDESAERRAGSRAAGKIPVSRRYQVVAALNAVLMIQFALSEVALPLWLLDDTRAPRVLVSGLLIANTALVVLMQVRAARGVSGVASAARALRLGGMMLALACAVTACAKGLSPIAATAVLLTAGILLTIGEVLTQAGAWTLSYDLADDRAVGAHQGVFNAGVAAGAMVGPLVVTQTALRHGLAGWVVLGALFAGAGAAIGPVVRRAGSPAPGPGDAR
ncbi:MAG: MFS transporter [Catenulispora sp.]|nr:MFS transporter [Catenulispora sp.]